MNKTDPWREAYTKLVKEIEAEHTMQLKKMSAEEIAAFLEDHVALRQRVLVLLGEYDL